MLPLDTSTLTLLSPSFLLELDLDSGLIPESKNQNSRIDLMTDDCSLQFLHEHLGIPATLVVFLAACRGQILRRAFGEAAL